MSKRLLLIGWDAADWKFLNEPMNSGKLPVLNQVVEHGIVGDLFTCQPFLAAAQWTSLATGKRPWQHRVAHAFEPVDSQPTAVPISRAHRRSAAIWEMLAARGYRSIVFGWPATHQSASALVSIVSDRYAEPTAPPGVKPWPPALPGTYWPDSLRTRLDPLRLSPENLGLDVMSRYLPHWKRVDPKRDQRMGHLRVSLAADLSHCAGMSALLQGGDWDFAAVRLPALGRIARLFLPFHPPRRDWINEHEFEIYCDVLRVECLMLDQTLGIFRKLAGADAAVMVVSAHGTRTPDVPPFGFPQRPEDGWKSPYGIIAAEGPGFARDALLHGSNVLDVAPTILHWFDLPIGDDMEGRVLLEGLAEGRDVKRIPSWDPIVPEHPAPPPITKTELTERIERETAWNLAQSCLEAGRFEDALPWVEELFRAFPERTEVSHALFQIQLKLGRLPEAEQTLEVFLETVPPGPSALLPRAELALAKRNSRLARSLVEQALHSRPENPALLRSLGRLLLRLRQWNQLAELAQLALSRDINEPIAWMGLAEALLRQKKPAEAAEAALRAIQLQYFLPDAHFILVRALVAQGRWKEASDAMGALQKIQPGNKTAAGYGKRLSKRNAPAGA
jgi:tetratricopeptide (TPR) repeat protein